MKFLDIAEVAMASGLPASTLRYYEEQRLIASVGRHGLRRQYEPEVLNRLALINMARAAGFLLSDVAKIFGRNREIAIPREELRARADALDQKAQEIKALAAMMRHVADCPAPSHLECSTFQKLLRVGTKHQSRMRRQRQRKGAALFGN
ncbi:helix-turn-helix domain-containing protein [Phyllobacterium bourgognense]|uniref:MerR family transcriptional regulator n=1 Tax=Phyllobacterium bourgognense TaxID=314236 RepID=A0A368Z7E5_9HYPH|nr:helix-turn-helix domain-containing protein [Phyllobacterium bourgognense]RCW87909.1 MerR family transcriptional regulator [Phyllobacterium bourgognense]